METLGRHILAEYHGCDDRLLDDRGTLESLLLQAARAAGATVVDTLFHAFSPRGITGVVVLEESHISIHTWPERAYAAVDFYTCGSCDPARAHPVLHAGLQASAAELLHVERGVPGAGRSMVIQEHGIADEGLARAVG